MKHYLLDFLKIIPKDKVVSYGFLGKVFNFHPRQVANILKNNSKQNIYPCYKVVNKDGSLGGYNLGVDEKIRRLENDGIQIENGKVLNSSFWLPTVKNFFVAFPLDGEEKIKFKNMYYELKKLSNGSFTLQNFKSPHVTLRFFGNMGFEKMYELIEKLFKNNFADLLEDKEIIFDKLGNFNERVWFFESLSNDNLKEIYDSFHKITGLELENRSYHPHLTIARVKNIEKFPKKEFLDIVSNYKFKIKLNKIRFYAAFDNTFQIPICDFEK